jgi:hypothetical protein
MYEDPLHLVPLESQEAIFAELNLLSRTEFLPVVREEALAPMGGVAARRGARARPHRHVVFTMPRLLRGVFRKRRERLLDLSQCSAEAITQDMRREVGRRAERLPIEPMHLSLELRHRQAPDAVEDGVYAAPSDNRLYSMIADRKGSGCVGHQPVLSVDLVLAKQQHQLLTDAKRPHLVVLLDHAHVVDCRFPTPSLDDYRRPRDVPRQSGGPALKDDSDGRNEVIGVEVLSSADKYVVTLAMPLDD